MKKSSAVCRLLRFVEVWIMKARHDNRKVAVLCSNFECDCLAGAYYTFHSL